MHCFCCYCMLHQGGLHPLNCLHQCWIDHVRVGNLFTVNSKYLNVIINLRCIIHCVLFGWTNANTSNLMNFKSPPTQTRSVYCLGGAGLSIMYRDASFLRCSKVIQSIIVKLSWIMIVQHVSLTATPSLTRWCKPSVFIAS